MTTLFDILNVSPAESVEPVQPAGIQGIAQTLAGVVGRGARQAAGQDTRPLGQRVATATQGADPTDPASLIQAAQRLDAIGESGRASALRQLAAKQELQGRDRFVTAGANVFDMQTGEWRTPPSKEEAEGLSGQMTANQIAGLYSDYTPESIREFIEDPKKPLVPLGEDADEPLTPEQRRAKTVAALQSTDQTLQNISLAEGVDVWNFGYDLFKYMPMSDSRALAGYVSAIQAELAFDRLQEMRDASETGGALGQVSEKELELLKNSLAALDPASPVFKEQLTRVRDHYNNFKNALLGLDPAGSSYFRNQDTGALMYYNEATEEYIDLDAQAAAIEGR